MKISLKSALVLLRRAGCLGLLAGAAFLLAAAGAASAATPAPTGPHTRADSPAQSQSESPEVAAARRKVADLARQLHALQVQLGDLKATEPQDPGPNATEAQRKKYKQDHAKWQAQVDKLTHQIDSLQKQLAIAEKNLEALLNK